MTFGRNIQNTLESILEYRF